MHRSSSTTRASDEFHLSLGMGMGTPSSNCTGGLLDYSSHLLPNYDPQSDSAKKEAAARARSSSGAIHLIPLVLIACAVVLWLFSSPQIGMTIKADSVVIAGIDSTTLQRLNNGTKVKMALELEVGALAAATAAEHMTSTRGTSTSVREEQVNSVAP
ncbi:hypothetical protein Taro_021434 [Colocasia esculenta]|uniref:Uncharacterized protein n=1 Tax=Colocasia esculenta TaxID=4460 RepID=A0A843URE6_COLES|nr:hypothetical protein [Colocasia esculenta]